AALCRPGRRLPDRAARAAAGAAARGSAGCRATRGWLRQQPLIAVEGAGNVVIKLKPPIREHRAAVAILADRSAVVGYQNDVGMLHAVAKRGGAFLAKPLVADLGDLVNQVDVELDRQAGAEGEPSPHAVRIGVDRHVEIAAELGEFLDIPGGRAPSRAVDAGDKGD